jgi:hypothetical protein
VRGLFVVLLLSAGQHLGRDVIYFLPELVPEVTPLINGLPPPVSAYGYGRVVPDHAHPAYAIPRSSYYDVGADRVVEWVKQNVKPGERVLCDYGVLGERLAWATEAEVLGGFRERNIAHAYANFFRRFGDEPAPRAIVEQYLWTFAVRYVILHELRPDLELLPELLEPVANLAGPRIYRVKLDTRPILKGGGVLRARTNRIEVRGSDPNETLLLSYHYHEALRCTPDCKVERKAVPLDEVGFISVPAPHPANLVVYNGY